MSKIVTTGIGIMRFEADIHAAIKF